MAWRYLGPSFDIHAGGADLLFPHHENERAQSCCAFPGSSFARIWIHNGMLRVEGQKMSKSLGNFTTTAPRSISRRGRWRRAGASWTGSTARSAMARRRRWIRPMRWWTPCATT